MLMLENQQNCPFIQYNAQKLFYISFLLRFSHVFVFFRFSFVLYNEQNGIKREGGGI